LVPRDRHMYLLVSKLVQNMNETFKDIPHDFRHIKFRPLIARRPVRAFPLEWVDQAIKREYERAARTGGPVAEWVEAASESMQDRKRKAAERAQIQLCKKEQFVEREAKRQERLALAEKARQLAAIA
jgi:hypothetical protein